MTPMFPETLVTFRMECGHEMKIKGSSFDELRKVALKEVTSFRNRRFCFKCERAKALKESNKETK